MCGLKDEYIKPDESKHLVEIVKDREGISVTRIALDTNHMFEGKHDELSSAIIKWLNEECEKRWEE